jgi:cytosine/adenosine deaminase-related metal-dependent hydrolase
VSALPRRTKLLIERCDVVATMDDAETEIAGGSILIEDGAIAWVGAGDPPGAGGAARVDGRGSVALPGLVNTHHHLYQTLTRVCAQSGGLFDWLKTLYPIWSALDAEWVYAAARVGLAELALSGCATTSDHHYVFPRGLANAGIDLLDAEIRAAREIGVRFHPSRGSMDLGASRGGLPPDVVVQDTDTILVETEDAVRRFHDPAPGSMLRIAIAPCSPFSVTGRLMRESAAMARRLAVRLHTHIAETRDEEEYCRATYGKTPLELLDDLGWMAQDVWLAHCVHVGDRGVSRIAKTQTGVAWCPTSNLRLGSGIAPARAFLDAGARIGLGVDGCASNDGGHMLAEARMGMLVSRAGGPAQMTAREALRIATRGGAACLGRGDIGSIETGRRADIALFGVDGLEFTGAERDPVGALLHCSPQRARHLFVEGRHVVRDGRLATADEDGIARQGRAASRAIAARASA